MTTVTRIASERIAACRMCGLIQSVDRPPAGATMACCRCESSFPKRRNGAPARTAALTMAALILYVPANIFPVLRMSFYGAYSESTVWDGCVSLFRNGQWPVAAVVFLASIVIPLIKLLSLLYLSISTGLRSTRAQRQRARLQHGVAVIGPWAMLDVFIVAILVALVKLGQLATVLPGPGLLAFCAVVVLTILASSSLDPQSLWDPPEQPS